VGPTEFRERALCCAQKSGLLLLQLQFYFLFFIFLSRRGIYFVFDVSFMHVYKS